MNTHTKFRDLNLARTVAKLLYVDSLEDPWSKNDDLAVVGLARPRV